MKGASRMMSVCLLAVCFVLGWGTEAWACPMCKEILLEGKDMVQRVASAKGYAMSISLLLVVPVLLVGGIGTAIFRSRRK